MKSFIKGLSLAALFAMATVAHAQQKIAIVDVQMVLSSLPQVATIEQQINTEFADQITEVQRLRSDGQYLVSKLQREEATLSEDQIKDLQQQINAVGQQLQEKGQPLQQTMQRRSQEERNKLLALIKQSIDSIAEKEGYDMILNADAVPFSKDKFEISEEVLAQVSKAK